MKKHIAVLAGDGIGPEITAGAVAVLQKVAQKYRHKFTFEYLPIGGAAGGAVLLAELLCAKGYIEAK